jgi:hypothetical protein
MAHDRLDRTKFTPVSFHEVIFGVVAYQIVRSDVLEGSVLVSSPRKRKRSDGAAKKMTPSSTQDRLESFMDKLSMWQLVPGLENQLERGKTDTDKRKDERDWMQVFCEDLVELQYASHIYIICITFDSSNSPCRFKSKLPDLCNLLCSKVFRNSPFSDSFSRASSGSPSPLFHSGDQGPHCTKKKYASSSTHPSPFAYVQSQYTSPALLHIHSSQSP